MEMWNTNTLWFDVAIVMSIFAFGSVLFGRFEEHKPRGRRVLKVLNVLAVTVGLAVVSWAFLTEPTIQASADRMERHLVPPANPTRSARSQPLASST